VVDWPSAQEFRTKLTLPTKDFHITLGYLLSDIHNVPKGKTSLVSSKEATK
jgi:hypothetical protein